MRDYCSGVLTRRDHLFLGPIALHFDAVPDVVVGDKDGVEPDRIYADKGYRGHDYEGEASVMLSGHKRGLSPQMKRELYEDRPLRRQSGI